MIPETTRLAGPFAGDDTTTVFPFTFVVFSEDDVKVTQSTDGVETVLTSGYTVSVNADQDADPGGDVTLTTALPTGDILAISGGTAYSQTLELPDGGNFSPASLNRALDRMVMQIQQLKEILDRTSATSITDGVNPSLPSPEANAFLAWNSAADELINVAGLASAPVSSAMEPVVAASTLTLARTAMGAGATGSTLFTAASAAAGRSTLSAAQSGANADITSTTALASISGLTSLNGGKFIPRGHIDGLTLSTAGSSATFTVAAGDATDGGQAVVMTLAASISKTTSAWAVGSGNGALDIGTIANSTWYHAWLIRRSDTGIVDVLVSLSATAPTMPTGYDQKRLIGSMRTNGSAQWTRFVQYGDEFWWFLPVLDASSSANPGTTAITETLENTPANRVTKAMVNASARNSGTGVYVGLYLSSLTLSDDLPAETTAPLASVGWSDGSAAGNRSNANPVQVWTNSNSGGGQIRWRINGSDANVNVYIATLGWIDPRGRNA